MLLNTLDRSPGAVSRGDRRRGRKSGRRADLHARSRDPQARRGSISSSSTTPPAQGLVDHFFRPSARSTTSPVPRVERGDFVVGAQSLAGHRRRRAVSLVMERIGWRDGHTIRIRKTIEPSRGWSPASRSPTRFDDLPEGRPHPLRRRDQPRRDGRSCRRPLLQRSVGPSPRHARHART